jgi:hypothetical protein
MESLHGIFLKNLQKLSLLIAGKVSLRFCEGKKKENKKEQNK